MLEYASTVWFPHTADGLSKLEGVQKKGVRFNLNVFGNHISKSHLLKRVNVQTLEARCQQ